MRIELLNDMYLEPQKSGGYSLYKRYTTAKVFDGYVKRVEECNRETVMKIVEKVEQELKSE